MAAFSLSKRIFCPSLSSSSAYVAFFLLKFCKLYAKRMYSWSSDCSMLWWDAVWIDSVIPLTVWALFDIISDLGGSYAALATGLTTLFLVSFFSRPFGKLSAFGCLLFGTVFLRLSVVFRASVVSKRAWDFESKDGNCKFLAKELRDKFCLSYFDAALTFTWKYGV